MGAPMLSACGTDGVVVGAVAAADPIDLGGGG
jgi:hypothetical protein